MKRLVLLFILALASPVFAANHYIRDGGSGSTTGTGDCADWTGTHACDTLPATLVRGDTYYIAGGTYSGKTLTMPSGTTTITIKRALIADHGTATGWQDSYSATANWGPLDVSSFGNLAIDGRDDSGNPGGIHITFAAGEYGFKYNDDVPNISLQYLDIEGPNTGLTNCAIGVWASGDFSSKSGLTIAHNKIHGTDTLIQTHTITDVTIEYNELYNTHSTSQCHGNVALVQKVTTGGIFRYNYVHDWEVEGFFITFPGAMYDSSQNQQWDIYGNLFVNPVASNSTRAVETHQDGSNWGPIKIYNNSFYNFDYSPLNLQGGLASGSEGKNNIFFVCTGTASGNTGIAGFSVHDYNWYRSCGTSPSETNKQDGGADPFVSVGSLDFHLAANTNAGANLNSPYNVDRDGVTRTTWSRGAYEFASGSTLTITTTTLPNATVSSAYSQTVSATGGTSPYTFSESGSNLGSGACTGLSIASNGTVSGTPTTSGTCSWTALVTDNVSATDTQALTITVDPAPSSSIGVGNRLRGITR